MKQIGDGRTMTVAEVAAALGYKTDTIRKKVKELFPEIVENGITTRLNEEQAIIVKNNLAPRTLALKSEVDNAVTELEKDETIAMAVFYLQERLQKAEIAKQEAEKARLEAEKARQEADRKNAILMHVKKTYTATEIAKELNMRSAQELNKLLEAENIQYKVNNTWVLTAKYADMGYTGIKQIELENGKVIYERRFTQMGRKMLLERFGGYNEQ